MVFRFAATDGVPPALAERVLERLGLPALPEPTLDGLRALYGAWCARVPFDNAQKRISLVRGDARITGGSAAQFFENLLAHGTGGTCWPTSIALAALLEAAGFRVRRVVASMNFERIGIRPGHASTVVELDGRDWLVDSSMLFVEPFALRRGEATERRHPVHPVAAEPRDGTWVIRWASPASAAEIIPCLFLEEGVPPERFPEAYEGTRSDRGSFFNRTLTVRRNLPDGGVLALRGETLARKSASGEVTTEPVTQGAERARVLVERFGFSPEIVAQVPPDEPPDPA